MIAGACVAGAVQAAHGLAWGGGVSGWNVAFEVISIFVELEVLTAVFDRELARRRSATRSYALSFAIAIGIGIAASFAGWAIESACGVMLVGAQHVPPAIVAQFGAYNGLVGLGLWAMAIVVPFAVRDANARAREAQELRTEAELARLRASLQPHFLMNTLTTIAGLISDEPREARDLVGALGDLLRDSLEEADEMQPLAAEIAWLQRYAQILETRHRGNLTFHWDIATRACDARVPRLLLQPLLENAVTHGALRRRDGQVSVRATIDAGGDRVTCVIEDNGPGPDARGPRAGARGLDLVTRRLALGYNGAAAFRLEADAGRTRSIVEIPVERT
jgi:LytS/YehU family sensor histidine kinase